MLEYVSAHWGQIATVLFVVSELLAEVESVKSNSIFQLLFGWLRSQKQA
jgi:hypothetical protein